MRRLNDSPAFAAAIACIAGGVSPQPMPPISVASRRSTPKATSSRSRGSAALPSVPTSIAAQLDSGPIPHRPRLQDYQGWRGNWLRLSPGWPVLHRRSSLADWTNAKASLFRTDASHTGISGPPLPSSPYHVNAGADVYGLLGYSGTTFKLQDLLLTPSAGSSTASASRNQAR